MTSEQFESLILDLVALESETEWVEFKHNKAIPKETGKGRKALESIFRSGFRKRPGSR